VAAQSVNNIGTATISQGLVLDPTNAQLRTTATIQFLNATQYTVNGGPALAYTSGNNIDVNGWRVQISGTPGVGDQFTVSDNTNGTGDNRNALLLSAALSQPLLNGAKTTLNDAVGQFLGGVGVQTNQAQANRDAQHVIYNDAVNSQQGVSGVNLDEEASNLMRYQQAYQAAAQVIKIASTLFQTVLDATKT
jgi:flagellar hook-associated protein 1